MLMRRLGKHPRMGAGCQGNEPQAWRVGTFSPTQPPGREEGLEVESGVTWNPHRNPEGQGSEFPSWWVHWGAVSVVLLERAWKLWYLSPYLALYISLSCYPKNCVHLLVGVEPEDTIVDCMGRCKSLGSLKSFLWYAPQLAGTSILYFHILSLLRAHRREWLQSDDC